MNSEVRNMVIIVIQRITSAVVALGIILPIFLIGGVPFTFTIYILSILGLREFLKAMETKKELPLFVNFISYIALTFLVLLNVVNTNLLLCIDYRVITGLFLVFLLPTVLYHDQKVYSIVDAFYLIGGIFFLGTSFSLMIVLRSYDMNLLLYLALITMITDTYALIVGSLVGKHPLLADISPKKTWEGTFGGSFFGVLVATVFYHVVVDPTLSFTILIPITLFLSILGQFGDLVFSAIKRYYKVKDFSNIMPGHGGILDRFDSLIFVILGFLFFITII